MSVNKIVPAYSADIGQEEDWEAVKARSNLKTAIQLLWMVKRWSRWHSLLS